ncbi:MAG: phospho-sugar mutase, partial [Bacteroidales bacterium]|nr:phospho-sugar mutase [Bacteroidales bacterium]
QTLYGYLQEIYQEFGYFKESLLSVTKKGKSGIEQIQQMMVDFRTNPPKTLADSPVVKVVDYNETEKTGLPKSNVLQFFSQDGCKVTVRPSGTEPKIKFYFSACGPDADARNQALRDQFSA